MVFIIAVENDSTYQHVNFEFNPKSACKFRQGSKLWPTAHVWRHAASLQHWELREDSVVRNKFKSNLCTTAQLYSWFLVIWAERKRIMLLLSQLVTDSYNCYKQRVVSSISKVNKKYYASAVQQRSLLESQYASHIRLPFSETLLQFNTLSKLNATETLRSIITKKITKVITGSGCRRLSIVCGSICQSSRIT